MSETRADRERALRNANVLAGGSDRTALGPEALLEDVTAKALEAKQQQSQDLADTREATLQADTLGPDAKTGLPSPDRVPGPNLSSAETAASVKDALSPEALAKFVGRSAAMSPEALGDFFAKQGGGVGASPPESPKVALVPGEPTLGPPIPPPGPERAPVPPGQGIGGSGPPPPAAAPPAPAAPPLPGAAQNASLAPAGPGPDELAAAQKKDNWRAAFDDAGDSFRDARDLIIGKYSPHAHESHGQTAVQQLAQKREQLRQTLEDKDKQAERDRQASLYDESSSQSKLATSLAIRQKLIKPGERIAASMWPLLKDGATLEEAREQHAAQMKNMEAERALQRRGQDMQLQMERERSSADLAKERVAKGLGKTGEVAPGYTRGNIQLKPEEESGFRDSVAARDELQSQAARLKQLLATNGTETFNTDAGKEMRNLAGSMRLKMKDLARLGALSGSDMDLLDSQIPSPNSLTPEWIANNTGALDAFTKGINRSVAARAHSLGLNSSEGAGAGQRVAVRPPGGGPARLVPADQVQAALAAGGMLAGG